MNSSDEEESRCTVEDIVASVLQTKSKLGGQLKSRAFRRKLRPEANDAALSIDPQESVSQNYLKSDCTPAGKSNYAFMKRMDDVNKNTFNSQANKGYGVCHSTSKLTRSVSTPEINVKFMPEPVSFMKSKAQRQVIFPSCDNDTAVSRLNDPDNLLKFLNIEEDSQKSQNLTKEREKSSSSRTLLNISRKHNTDSMKQFQRNTWSFNYKTDDNKENIASSKPNTQLDDKLPAVPFTSALRKSDSLHCFKREERNVLETIQDNMNKEKNKVLEVNISVKEKSKSTSSLSLQIGNSELITVNNLNYLKMGELGKGGSSVVYEVLDMQTKQRKAIKVVTLDEEDEETRQSYKNEIKILQKLQYSPRIIKLYDHDEGPSHLKLVMEAGSVDLASILSAARQKKGKVIPAFTVKHYWQEMLLAVQDIHKEGIIHSDLKPANFLQANGMLKLIDFGIASSVQQDMTSVFKDSQSGTYNFMSPESLNDIYSGPIISSTKVLDKPTIKINVKSDVWSLGCILYNLTYGKTPFQHVMNPLQKLAAISNPKTRISFPPINDEALLDVLQKCLQYDANKRPAIKELISHPYLVESASLQASGKDTNVNAR